MPSWDASSHGVRWHLELERDRLLPGRPVSGAVTVTPDDGTDARHVVVTLIGHETWQHERTTTDGEGRTHTETVTSNVELPRVPVELSGPISLPPGESQSWPFQLPVPPLGPGSVDGTVLRLTWVV